MLKSPLQRWSAGTALVCLLLVLAGWFGVVAPTRAAAADLRAQEADQQTRNVTLQQDIVTLRRQYGDLPATRKQLTGVLRTMPTTAALPTVVAQLRALEKHSGVTVTKVTTDAGTALTAAAGSGAVPVVRTEVTVEVTGLYYQVVQLLRDLGGKRMPRAFLVTDIAMTQEDAADGTVTVQVTGDVFSLPEIGALVTKAQKAASAATAAQTSSASASTRAAATASASASASTTSAS